MRFSKSFINTIKQTPRGAVLPSHVFLLRAGFISMLGSGIYNFLPIGKVVLDKVKPAISGSDSCIYSVEVKHIKKLAGNVHWDNALDIIKSPFLMLHPADQTVAIVR